MIEESEKKLASLMEFKPKLEGDQKKEWKAMVAAELSMLVDVHTRIKRLSDPFLEFERVVEALLKPLEPAVDAFRNEAGTTSGVLADMKLKYVGMMETAAFAFIHLQHLRMYIPHFVAETGKKSESLAEAGWQSHLLPELVELRQTGGLILELPPRYKEMMEMVDVFSTV